MDLAVELNFAEICRCCKRTESGMTSIFGGNAHSAYPPVNEMLRSIASLNVHEDDGLPSLVCTLCLNSIQNAFTFILQLTLIEEELMQMLAKRKEADILPQSCYVANHFQQILTDFVKEEIEFAPEKNASDDMNHSLKLDEPLLHFTHNYELIDMEVKSDVVPVAQMEEAKKLHLQEEQCNAVPELAYFIKLQPSLTEITIQEDIQLNSQIYHPETNENITANNSPKQKTTLNFVDDDLLMVQNTDVVDEFEYEDDVEVDEDYQDYSMKGGKSVDATKAVKDTEIAKIAKISPTLERKGCQEDVKRMYKCKFCAYTNRIERMSDLKRHLLAHLENKPFTCSKCTGTFVRRDNMMSHWRNCNGKIPKTGRNKPKVLKQVLSLTLKDLKDPKKVMECYKETERDLQNNDNNSEVTLFTCRLCAYTNRQKSLLKRHLQSHSKDKPFTCSKCSASFMLKSSLVRHLRNCTSVITENARQPGNASKQVLSLSELEDPLKIKKYYTKTKMEVLNNVKVQKAKDIGDDVHERHLQSHVKDKPFACSKCTAQFVQRRSLLQHSQNCTEDMGDAKTVVAPVPEVEEAKQLQLQQEIKSASPTEITIREEIQLNSQIYYSETNEDINENNSLASIDEPKQNMPINLADDDLMAQNTDVVMKKPFTCSKCTGTFVRRHNMMCHWRNCNGKIPKPVLSLTCTKSQSEGPKRVALYKCDLCAYSNARLWYIKLHLPIHFKDKPFACSKCTNKFAQRGGMLRHSRNCTGKMTARQQGNAPRRLLSLTLQDLEDPLKMKQYYTKTEMEELPYHYDGDNAQVQKGRDMGDVAPVPQMEETKQSLTEITISEDSQLNSQIYYSETNEDDDGNLLMVQKADVMEDFEYEDVIEVDGDYQVYNKSGVDAAEAVTDTEIAKIGTTSKKRVQKTVVKCKFCAFSFVNTRVSILRRHLLTHLQNKPFKCSKCSGRFVRRDNMLYHWRNCNGEKPKTGRKSQEASKQVLSLTLKDLEDPKKVMECYNESDLQNMNNDDDSEVILFKCRLCAFANRYKSVLKRHLQTHFTVKPFSCAKCSATFTRKHSMQKHVRMCNGENNAPCKGNASKQVLSLTMQDLKDPLTLTNLYYTVTKGYLQNPNNDDVIVQRAEDRSDVVEGEIPLKSHTERRKTALLKCKLCAFTNVRMSLLKQHLQSHFKDKPFTCPNCSVSFMLKSSLVRHLRKCTRVITPKARQQANASKQVIALTLKDLEDPEKMKQYYTEIEAQKNDDNDVSVQRDKICAKSQSEERSMKSERSVFKCKFCDYKNARESPLKQHLQTHVKGSKLSNASFTCSKCNGVFLRRHNKCHWRNCNGRQKIPFTLEDLEDPLKAKNYYSVTM